MAKKRAAFPRDEIEPNENDPATHPPGTVGSPDPAAGDPDGVVVTSGPPAPPWPRSILRPSAWSGWPAEWDTPLWGGQMRALTDTAWGLLDLNARVIASMPPYLVRTSPSPLDADWLKNPDPDLYRSWHEFARQLFWDFQMGEAYVMCTARYSTEWPARFHVVPPWLVNSELGGDGLRHHSIGGQDVTANILQIPYSGTTSDARGHGPLEYAMPRMVAAQMLLRYASNLAQSGGVPHSVLTHPNRLSATQAADLQAHWVEARMSSIGLPAVLSGGLQYEAMSFDPEKMALVDLAGWNDARIAFMLGVPAAVAELPTQQTSLTYNTTRAAHVQHWHMGLLPMVDAVMSALSEWAVPRGTAVEVDRSEYIRLEPNEQAQYYQTMFNIVDPVTGERAMELAEIRERERLSVAAPTETLTSGALQ